MSDQTSSAMDGGFGKFVPGFEFLQKLAGGAGMTKSLPQMPGLGSWVAPTYNVEDIEKRIEELKAVQFWLDQNAKALAATIQALEVQKMTLATLKTMNLSMGDVAQSLGAMVGLGGGAEKPAAAPAHTPFAGLEIPPRTYGNPLATPEPEEKESSASADETASPGATGVIDPMQWWGALTQQFQQIANTALQDASRQLVPGLGDTPAAGGTSRAKPQGSKAASSAAPASATRKPASQRTPAKKAPARQGKAAAAQPMGAGDWPMPTAFFQMPGFPGMGEPAKKKRAASATSTSTGRSTPAAAGKPRAAAKKSASSKATPASRRR